MQGLSVTPTSLTLKICGPLVLSSYSFVADCQQSETSEVLESLASFRRCLTDFSSSCREDSVLTIWCNLNLMPRDPPFLPWQNHILDTRYQTYKMSEEGFQNLGTSMFYIIKRMVTVCFIALFVMWSVINIKAFSGSEDLLESFSSNRIRYYRFIGAKNGCWSSEN